MNDCVLKRIEENECDRGQRGNARERVNLPLLQEKKSSEMTIAMEWRIHCVLVRYVLPLTKQKFHQSKTNTITLTKTKRKRERERERD
jgi:hypothetical protein